MINPKDKRHYCDICKDKEVFVADVSGTRLELCMECWYKTVELTAVELWKYKERFENGVRENIEDDGL